MMAVTTAIVNKISPELVARHDARCICHNHIVPIRTVAQHGFCIANDAEGRLIRVVTNYSSNFTQQDVRISTCSYSHYEMVNCCCCQPGLAIGIVRYRRHVKHVAYIKKKNKKPELYSSN
jgi:hypothetical protein